MRRIGQIGLALGFVLAAGSPASAGLYDPAKPTSPFVTERGVRPLPYELFFDVLTEVRNIGDAMRTTKARTDFLGRREALLKRGLSTLSPTEMVELAFVQQRLRQSDEALNTLRQAQGRDQRNFWVQTELGTIYQATNQFQEAAPFVDLARASFPETWPGGKPSGDWFKKVEGYQFALLRLRLKETGGRTGRRLPPAQEVDDLFHVRFVGPSGHYEAGKLAEAEKAKLPEDAVVIVQQLILWFPDDTRLLWLLGELYNANGDLGSADRIFQECVGNRSYDSPTVRERRRIVKEARDTLAQQQAATASNSDKPKEPLLPDKMTLWTVGAISGAILVALGWWQFRELFRRLRASTRPSS